jgi:hypothetical protein
MRDVTFQPLPDGRHRGKEHLQAAVEVKVVVDLLDCRVVRNAGGELERAEPRLWSVRSVHFISPKSPTH